MKISKKGNSQKGFILIAVMLIISACTVTIMSGLEILFMQQKEYKIFKEFLGNSSAYG